MTISELGAREDHEGVWHAVTDDESDAADTTALCGAEVAEAAPTGAWEARAGSAARCEVCDEMLAGEHRDAGFSVENIGGVPTIRSRDDPPWE